MLKHAHHREIGLHIAPIGNKICTQMPCDLILRPRYRLVVINMNTQLQNHASDISFSKCQHKCTEPSSLTAAVLFTCIPLRDLFA